MLVPPDALPGLKCDVCDNYLSYFPIFNVRDNKRPICGRCEDFLIDNECVRDTAYEALAKYLKFPCMYASEGCVDHFTPTDIPAHEQVCPYKIISCPLDCIWQGSGNELLSHVEATHRDYILRNSEFGIDVGASYEVLNFLVHQNELFILKQKFDSCGETLECSLFCYSVTKYFYEVTLYDGTRNLSVQFPPGSADSFEEQNIIKIAIGSVRTKLANPAVILGSVEIFTSDSPRLEVKEKKPHPEVNLEMLSELECPVCLEYILPPIYQCITGHSICFNCKQNINVCPSCKKEIDNTQNFTLQKMTELIMYPCKHAEYGCDFVSKSAEMKQHQEHCHLGPEFCPLQNDINCRWSGPSRDTYSHLLQRHQNILLGNQSIRVSNTELINEDNKCYLKMFSDVMFKLRYRYSQNQLCWAMQLIGPPEKAKDYKFEIDILDNSHNQQKMFLRSVCTGTKSRTETFAHPGGYIFIHLEQVRSFMTDHLSYTVRVSKK